MATWREFCELVDPKIIDECRAGIVVGFRLELSKDPTTACAVQRWASSRGDVELWVVDDLQGLAPHQPFVLGMPILQTFGLDDDHRIGLSIAEFDERVAAAGARMAALSSELAGVLGPDARPPGEAKPWFTWSGPLCGGFLVKGVFREQVADDDRWFASMAKCRVYQASRGASQDPAPGGVHGFALVRAIYDNSHDSPELDQKLLGKGDAALRDAGLLDQARLFALPHYD